MKSDSPLISSPEMPARQFKVLAEPNRLRILELIFRGVHCNCKFGEALPYGLIVALSGGFAGALIGLVIGVSKWGVLGGGLVGVLATLAVVALYVITFSRPGQQLYFLSQSGIFVIVLGLPMILTGILAALFKKAVKWS